MRGQLMACDNVRVEAGGFVLRGAFDTIDVDNCEPFTLFWRAWGIRRPFRMSLRVTYPAARREAPKRIESVPMEVAPDPKSGMVAGRQVLNLPMLQISEPGMHNLSLLIDGKQVANAPLRVNAPKLLH